jgi:glycogen debranching enzyme
MDAKCGDRVFTPRHGKAVEICALWYNFLKILCSFHKELDEPRPDLEDLADKALIGFGQFWNEEKGCLFDVIGHNGQKDSSVRPNQLFALGLPHSLLGREQSLSVLKVVEEELLTPFGLRTLSSNDPNYHGTYGLGNVPANQFDRDMTYHQGMVWPWLTGIWVDARMKLFGSSPENISLIANQLSPLKHHIMESAGIGNVSEIFDGDAPHLPRGCIAQAWSVAELLRVLVEYPELGVGAQHALPASRVDG